MNILHKLEYGGLGETHWVWKLVAEVVKLERKTVIYIEEYGYGYGSFIYYDILFAFILTRLYFYKNRNKSKIEKIAYY